MNEFEKTQMMVEICKLYYEHNLQQQAIADRLHISRSYISKLLREAKERNIVRIEIADPFEIESPLEEKIRKKFKLNKVIVVPVETHAFEKKLEAVGECFAKFLYQIIRDGDIIGVTWGITMDICSSMLVKKNVEGCIVTQLNGGLTHKDKGVNVNEIINRFASAFGATPYYLTLPAILDSEEMKNTIVKDRNIADVLTLAKNANIAVFAVGEFGFNSSLSRIGYLSEQMVQSLLRKGVVGDICSRLIDINGVLVDNEFDKRLVGISLEDLRKKDYRILLSAEDKYVQGIHGALSGGYANVFITDEGTASALANLF